MASTDTQLTDGTTEGADKVRSRADGAAVPLSDRDKQLLDLMLVLRPRNKIGNVFVEAAEGSNCVEIRAAVAVFGALLFALRTERRERARRGLNRWCGKLNALKRHRSFGRLRREAKERLNPGRGRLHLGGADRGVLETPPPTAALTLAHA